MCLTSENEVKTRHRNLVRARFSRSNPTFPSDTADSGRTYDPDVAGRPGGAGLVARRHLVLARVLGVHLGDDEARDAAQVALLEVLRFLKQIIFVQITVVPFRDFFVRQLFRR